MLKCYRGHEGHLDGDDEDEYIEDSDYESEPESPPSPIHRDTKVNSEQKKERKLLPVLSVGSSIT